MPSRLANSWSDRARPVASSSNHARPRAIAGFRPSARREDVYCLLRFEADRGWAWKVKYWTDIYNFAMSQLAELRKGDFELKDHAGRNLIPEQIEQHERDA